MKMLTVLLLGLLSLSPIARAQNAFDATEVKLLPITPDVEMAAAKALHRCDPVPGKIVGEINKNNIYTLTGDIFHNGRIYSVIDDNADVIICEWHAPDWDPVSVINIQTVWNFPEGFRERVGRSPDNQPNPFWTINLQDRTLLVIASYVEKEGQYYYVVLFNSTCTHILGSASSFSVKPEVKLAYLLTGDSRVKSDYEVNYFSKLHNNVFVMQKSWAEFDVWRAESKPQPDDSGNIASSNGVSYTIYDEPTNYDPFTGYRISNNDLSKKGKVHINLIAKENPGPDDALMYIFEKLTGLPRELYPDFDPSRAEMKWEVKVTGDDPALVKLLTK